jgi:hypothetical protein
MAVQVGAGNVFGRDRLIEQMWKKLGTKSLRFTAERRIGKTTVMQKMEAEPPDGTYVLFLDLEGIDSPTRFTEALLTRMRPLLSMTDRALADFKSLVKEMGGTELGGLVKLPKQDQHNWPSTLEKAFDGICEGHPDTRLVLMFDELPYMLQKISAKESHRGSGENAALEMLDIMRSRRMAHANLRMIFAGSVGLHHVLDSLRGSEVASEPFNDMPSQEIAALEIDDARALAHRLIITEQVGLAEAKADTVAAAIADLTDCVPFYIERVIARLAELGRAVSPEDVSEVVGHHLADDHDEWEMEHFRTRLKVYYTGTSKDANGNAIENTKIAGAILDVLSLATSPQTIDSVWSDVKAKLPLDDRDQIVRLLKSLAQDHYLKSDEQKRYAFRFPLVQRWWVLAQGLSK